MGKVGRAVAGVIASAAVLGGSYLIEADIHHDQQEAVQRCTESGAGKTALKECIDNAKDLYDTGDSVDIMEIAGIVGVIGCGYLGYKAIKEENQTTGIVDDYL
jgi:hypothetical protein